MIKLPEPEGIIGYSGGRWEYDWIHSQDAYSEDQLTQYGDDRAREALESAAAISRKYNHPIAGVIEHEIIALSKDEL
jgi:hypothetical protein